MMKSHHYLLISFIFCILFFLTFPPKAILEQVASGVIFYIIIQGVALFVVTEIRDRYKGL